MSLRRVPLDEMEPEYRNRVDAARAATGESRFLEVVANAPHMADFYFGDFYRDVFFAGTVPVRVKELMRLRLSNLHGCAY